YGRERPIAPALHRHWWHGSALALRLRHGRILAHATRYPALRRRVPARQPHSFPGRWVGEAVCGRGYGGRTSGRSMNGGQGATVITSLHDIPLYASDGAGPEEIEHLRGVGGEHLQRSDLPVLQFDHVDDRQVEMAPIGGGRLLAPQDHHAVAGLQYERLQP